MKGDRIPAKVLATRIIANLEPAMADALQVPAGFRSAALLTTTCDDVTYVALDEATKRVASAVSYARSFYGGADNANTALAGEVLGILTAPDPASVRSALECCVEAIEQEISFVSANDEDSVIYFAHCVSRTGAYLSQLAGIPEGDSLAYLIAPPLEAMFGVDAALKAADVRMCVLYGPPSETNFGGALLTGTQSACKAACEAFAAAVEAVAATPREDV